MMFEFLKIICQITRKLHKQKSQLKKKFLS